MQAEPPATDTVAVAHGLAEGGPALEPVPALAAPAEGLPVAATWPLVRHQRRLRLLAVLNLQQSAAPYQRIARRCRAALDLTFTAHAPGGVPDDISTLAHTNDKWIEASQDPTAKEVADDAVRHRQGLLAAAAGRYDVIFCSDLVPELADFARRGGLWVVCGNVYPDAQHPLATLWPAQPAAHRSWHHAGAVRGEAPELAGLPLERLSGHCWFPLALPGTDAEALATGETGATIVRRVGAGAIVFVPTGPISRTWNVVERFQRLYDHDEIWLRYWDQLLHGLVGGERALPAVADLPPVAQPVPPGTECRAAGRIVNLGADERRLTVAVHVVSPLGQVVFARADEELVLPARATKPWELRVPVAEHWATGLYATHLTIADPVARQQIHQALTFLPVAGAVQCELAADKPGYRRGEQATFTLRAAARTPWRGQLRWAAHDFRGRVLGSGTRPAELASETKTLTFTWDVADHGVRVGTVWVTAAAIQDGREWARAECKVYRHEPWDMRNEYQWSTWSAMACQPPCLVPEAMRLMGHAGLNALGYPGRNELSYAAERWSWRMYNEGVGTNTFSPLIESVTDEEIAAAQLKTLRGDAGADLRSGALVLASVGEEAGFATGWGRTYYWDDPVAPGVACQAFRRFLRERYPSLDTLNAAWGTRYREWDAIPLTKEFSGPSPKLEADGWAHPHASPIGAGAAGVTLAPYQDTRQFYHWYYDKVVGAALQILRTQLNPVPLTMASAPASWIFLSPRCETRLAGGSSWMECQQWSLAANGPAPGFALVWGHFDWPVAAENMLWGFVLTRSGHNNYWVDVPLMFNPDMTHTRASLAIRRWRAATAHAERLLLDAVPFASEAAVLGPSGGFQPTTPGDMANSVKIALNQGGFGFAEADLQNLAKHKIVFAVYRDALSPSESDALAAYVDGGGTLVFTPRFAGRDQHGVPQKIAPGCGLADRWGFRVTGKTEAVPQYYPQETVAAPLDSLGPPFRDLRLASHRVFVEQVEHAGWTAQAAYPDGTPAVLVRPMGRGRLVYLNAAYRSQWYIQWVTPTDRARQGFYRLIEQLCLDAGVRRTFRIDGDLAQTLHMAALQWTDPSGHIAYAVARTNGEVPWTSGTLHWLGPHRICYDVYGGDPQQPAPSYGTEVPLHLRPGAGRLLAFTPAPVATVRVTAAPERFTAGQSLPVKVEILDESGTAVPGRFPVELRVTSPAGAIAGLRRDVSVASGDVVTLATARNDPPGRWTIVVRDGITRRSGEAAVVVAAPADGEPALAFRPWGWPSEQWEAERMPASEFVALLRQLAAVYRTDCAGKQWLAKQWLGAHYCFFAGTRHAIVRRLSSVDWLPYQEDLRQAVAAGAKLILVGEDLGLDPATGLSVFPCQDARQREAVAAALAEATWESLSPDGETVRARLGEGSLVLCRNTPDGTGHTWRDAVAWQQRLLATLGPTPDVAESRDQGNAAGPAEPCKPPAPNTPATAPPSVGVLPAPDAARLTDWLAGRVSLVPGPRMARWQGAWKQTWDGGQDLVGPVFLLRIPPTGAVKSATVCLEIAGAGPVSIDVGADGQVEAQATPGAAAAVPWGAALARYLDWRTTACSGGARDLNGWRLVPIRFAATGKAEVSVRATEVVVE